MTAEDVRSEGYWLAQAEQQQARLAEWLLGLCDSPIERLMVATALACGYRDPSPLERDVWIREAERRAGLVMTQIADLSSDSMAPRVLLVQPSVPLPDRHVRLDFALLGRDGTRVAIELDGHDFHERTKQQATRDKSRDRALTLRGWLPLRFTGSEVYADPYRCLRESEQVLRRRPQSTFQPENDR